MVAAKTHAPKRYQTAPEFALSFSGVNKRAIPAKSKLQKANAKMVDHLKPANCRSPSKSFKANSVVL
jgi:hypothetical protein